MLKRKCKVKTTVSFSLLYESLLPVVLDHLTAQAKFTVLQFSSVLECGLLLGTRLGRHFFPNMFSHVAFLCLFGRGDNSKCVN